MMATFAIFFWPIVSVTLFSALGPARGLIWSATIGFLFLPERWSFDLPSLPPYGKYEAMSLGMVLGALVTRSRMPPRPEADAMTRRVLTAFLALLLLSPFVTMATNGDGFMIGINWFPPISLADIRSSNAAWLVALVPFLLARRLLHDPEMHREALWAMVITGVVYAFLALYELRMSPQLNNLVYGYFPHSWIQHIRGGGWRPLVFLAHGLELGFYLLTAVLAAAGLVRTFSRNQRALFMSAMLFLFAVLAISRNLGAFAICMLLLPAAFMVKPKMHLRIAVVVAVLFTTYPLARDVYIPPALALAERVSDTRHQSLEFRFENEDMLIDRAAERPLAGWGPWGRWHVHDEETGRVLTVSDGVWIIQLGTWGWLGFVALFGLIVAPLLLMWRALRRVPLTPVTSAMVLMAAAHLIYMIPNATLSPVTWLVTGALAGFVQFAPGRVRAAEAAAAEAGAGDRRPRHSRFAPSNGPRGRSREERPVPLTRFGPKA